ncbi:MAG: HlyD family secretion protein, partial [Magnetococcales bacterium]|nr:HlyD family secretion protein [Magnetococcales bacterium]
WLQISNLRQHALAWLSYVLKVRLSCWPDSEPPPLRPSRREGRIYLIYGFLAVLYLIVALFGIGWVVYGYVAEVAGTLGVLLFILLVARLLRLLMGAWGQIVWELVRRFLFGTGRRRRVAAGVGVGALLLLLFWSSPVRVVADGRIGAPELILRAAAGGFVTAVNVDARRLTVAPGVPLVWLAAVPLPVETMAESVLPHAADVTAADASSRVAVVAPVGAWLVEGSTVGLLGRFVPAGAELLRLVAARERFVDVALVQSDFVLVAVGDVARVRLRGGADELLTGVVERVAPVAVGGDALFVVRVRLGLPEGVAAPPPGVVGEVAIFGRRMAVGWQVWRWVRRFLRADLWV